MPYLTTLPAPPLVLPLEPLTPTSFAPFGTVIVSPPSPTTRSLLVNQGSATKHPQISPFISTYPTTSPAASSNLNLFICRPRTLTPSGEYLCTVLERHPYTSQTFTPLPGPRPKSHNGGDRNRDEDPVRWVVIVAPTREETVEDVERGVGEKGRRGLPDLERMRAFVVGEEEAKAVTYAPGTWHAPMVVVGRREIGFIVAVNENGVGKEDLEEVRIEGGVRVRVEMGGRLWKAKL
ncbi:hypothetical protein EX30DRAFT_396721 [Ascodesmis nigricans]|uniref:Ureidoglycolate hydrolase n=1 Tax=Ascodesmis nigricans TaxID=341454 RepID=A0A4S2MTT3_9PEZI|nr:hypothetical protein EX30DRAFT_396721 [Ascodesmis nigricans]